MPDEVNPYASPRQPSPPPAPVSQAGGGSPFGVLPQHAGLWRDGNLLVMHRMARLPKRCVKSNRPTEGRLRRRLAWHHPAIYLAILIGLLVYVILALVLTKKATIFIGLSEEWFARRRNRILIAWGVVLVSVAMFFGGIAAVDSVPGTGWLIGLSPFVLLGAAIYGLVGARMVVPTRMTDEHIWLKGVHPAYLAELPPLPIAR